MQNGNGSGDGQDHNDKDSNIIRLPGRAERKARTQDKAMRVKVLMGSNSNIAGRDSSNAAMINLPPLTKILIAVFLGLHVVKQFLDPKWQYWMIEHFGFIPARYTGGMDFDWSAVVSPVTYGFLHGGWGHLLMNVVMMMAFGSALERFMGWKKLAVLMLGSSMLALPFYFAVSAHSDDPVIGASGGLSGMFAAAIMMMQSQSGFLGQGKFRYLPLVLLWIAISALFGFMGGPHGENIAWVAHIGGFIAGFILYKPVMKLVISD